MKKMSERLREARFAVLEAREVFRLAFEDGRGDLEEAKAELREANAKYEDLQFALQLIVLEYLEDNYGLDDLME